MAPFNRLRPISPKRRLRSGRAGKIGIVRLYGKDLERLREERYAIDGGRCVDCGEWRPLHGDVFMRMHLTHVIGRGRGGSDTIENTRMKCFRDHIEREHNCGGKPLPAKH